MFGRILSKGLKNVSIDSKTSHIVLKDTNFSLVIMRPYDLVQLGDLVGSGSEDILIWTGKTIGKALLQKIQEKKNLKNQKKIIEELLVNLTNLGFGKFNMKYNAGKNARIEIINSIANEISEDEDKQLICNLYQGVFIGIFNALDLEVEIEEYICPKQKDPRMFFKIEIIDLEDI